MNPADPQSGKVLSPTRATWAQAVDLLRAMLGRREHEAERSSDRPRPPEVEPRDAALWGMLWSAPLAALTIFSAYAFSQDSRFEPVLKVFGQFSAVFLVPLLVYTTQFVTNVRFWDLSDRWDELKGWQRGVFGLAFVALAGAVILSVAFFVGMHLAAGLIEG